MSNKKAFTLAEVLIALAIVGVVAAITIPPLITNIQSQVKAKRVQNIKQKFSKATDKMLAMNGMNGYGSTENFVEELKHHLKIAKVCDNDHLTECWGYEKVKLKDGKEWEISKTKTGKSLKMKDDDNNQWDKTVGIVTADGTSMILSYNKKCNMTINVNPQWDEDKSTSSECVAMVFDYNGAKKPNKFVGDITSKDYKKSDIIAFNAGGLGFDCVVEINGRCFIEVVFPKYADAVKYGYTWCAGHEPTSVSGSAEKTLGAKASATTALDEDGVSPSSLGIKQCGFIRDYWNASVKACGGVKKLPTKSDIEKLTLQLYKTPSGTHPTSINEVTPGNNKLGYTIDKDLARVFGWKTTELCLWGDTEDSYAKSLGRVFYEDKAGSYGWSHDRFVGWGTLCTE